MSYITSVCYICLLNVCYCSDVRVNYCFTKFENGRCLAPKPQNMSKEACCCTGMPGQGWGDPCEICPSKGDGMYHSHYTETLENVKSTQAQKQRNEHNLLVFDSSHLVPDAYVVLCPNVGYTTSIDDHQTGKCVINTESALLFPLSCCCVLFYFVLILFYNCRY